MEDIVNIRILYTKTNVTKLLLFKRNESISNVLQTVGDKSPESVAGDKNNVGTMGLFLINENSEKDSQWLAPDNYLDFYGINNGTMIEYKEKMRYLRIRSLDGAVKTLLIDDSLPVSGILKTIGERFNLQNIDEYSLILDTQEDVTNYTTLGSHGTLGGHGTLSGYGTLTSSDKLTDTLKKSSTLKSNSTTSSLALKKIEERDRKKMDDLKKKLHTDDELQWLIHDKTLREQGVNDNSTLVLRRKFFYQSNQNIKDKSEITLLYNQCRDGILDGTHQCEPEETSKLTALMLQVQLGDYDEAKLVDWDCKDYVSKENAKNKSLEKKIKDEYKILVSVPSLQAMFRYINICQGLPTYGVTIFLVKEKAQGKNKLAPVLFGITKASVLRMDERTKKILKTWPLTAIKRWAASPKSFTLDFGDYSDGFYSVQTSEGEQISQLIAGYIDLILKSKKSSEGMENETEESCLIEDTIAPGRALIIEKNKGKSLLSDKNLLKNYACFADESSPRELEMNSMEGFVSVKSGKLNYELNYLTSKRINIEKLNEQQRSLLVALDTVLTCVNNSVVDIDEKTIKAMRQNAINNPDLSNYENSMLNLSSYLSILNASIAELLMISSADVTDQTVIETVISSIYTIIPQLKQAILGVCVNNEKDQNSLMDEARNLLNSLNYIINNYVNLCNDNQPINVQNVLLACGQYATASTLLCQKIKSPDYKLNSQDELLNLVKLVAAATSDLVRNIKDASSSCEQESHRAAILASAKLCATNTAQLVSVVRVLAPTIRNQICFKSLTDSAKIVLISCEESLKNCRTHTKNDFNCDNLFKSSLDLKDAINNLINYAEKASNPEELIDNANSEYVLYCDNILNDANKLYSNFGNSANMISHAKLIAENMYMLINSVNNQADMARDNSQTGDLLIAAKCLADATSHLVDTAKAASINPYNEDEQKKLLDASESLIILTNSSLSNIPQKLLIAKLMNSIRHVSVSSSQLIAACQSIGPIETNKNLENDLTRVSKILLDKLNDLNSVFLSSLKNIDKPTHQLNALIAVKNFISVALECSSKAQQAAPIIINSCIASNVLSASKRLENNIETLRIDSHNMSSICESIHLDTIIESIQSNIENMKNKKIIPIKIPIDISKENKDLIESFRHVFSTLDQFNHSIEMGNKEQSNDALNKLMNDINNIMNSTLGIMKSGHPEAQNLMNYSVKFMNSVIHLLNFAKISMSKKEKSYNNDALKKASIELVNSINDYLNSISGFRFINKTIKDAENFNSSFNEKKSTGSSGQISDNKKKFIDANKDLNSAMNSLINTISNSEEIYTQQFDENAKKFNENFCNYFKIASIIYGNLPENEKAKFKSEYAVFNSSTVSLMHKINSFLLNPSSNTRCSLIQSINVLSDSINLLFNSCLLVDPFIKECDTSIQKIDIACGTYFTENVMLLVTNESYKSFADKSAILMNQLKNNISNLSNLIVNKSTSSKDLQTEVIDLTDRIIKLVNSLSQASYLAAVNDKETIKGKEASIDHKKIQEIISMIAEEINKIECHNYEENNTNFPIPPCDMILEDDISSNHVVRNKKLPPVPVTKPNLKANFNSPLPAPPEDFIDDKFPITKKPLPPTPEKLKNNVSYDLPAPPEDFDDKISIPKLRIKSSTKLKRTGSMCSVRNSVHREYGRTPENIEQLSGFIESLCRKAATNIYNPEASSEFNKLANQLLDSCSNLIICLNDLESSKLIKETSEYKAFVENIESIVKYSNLPEFQMKPPKLSEKGKETQRTLINNSKDVIESIKTFILCLKNIHSDSSQKNKSNLNEASEKFSKICNNMLTNLKAHDSGNKDLMLSLKKHEFSNKILQEALSMVCSNRPTSDENIKKSGEKFLTTFKHLKEAESQFINSIKNRLNDTNIKATLVSDYITILSQDCISFITLVHADESFKTKFIEVTRALVNISSKLTETTLLEENSKINASDFAIEEYEIYENEMNEMVVSLDDLIRSCKPLIENIIVSIGLLNNATKSEDIVNEDIQDDIFSSIKEIAKINQNIIIKSLSNPEHLFSQCKLITNEFEKLCHFASLSHNSMNPEVSSRLKENCKSLGKAVNYLLEKCELVSSNPGDYLSKKELTNSSRNINEKIQQIISSLKSASIGTQSCIEMIELLNALMSDIDTSLLFARSLSLITDKENDCFSSYINPILNCARDLVDSSKKLVLAANESQNSLASAIDYFGKCNQEITRLIKDASSSINSSDHETQVMLLNAMKDTLNSSVLLVETSKKFCINDDISLIDESSKKMAASVTSLIKTVQSVDDKSSQGIRCLEAMEEYLIKIYKSDWLKENSSKNVDFNPVNIVHSSKALTLSTANMISLLNNQNHKNIVSFCNSGRKIYSDLIEAIRGCIIGCNCDSSLSNKLVNIGKDCIETYNLIIKNLIMNLKGNGKQVNFSELAKKVADNINKMVIIAERMKGDDFEDPDDPIVKSEKELLQAAASIEAAAKKLLNLQPRLVDTIKVNENLSFSEHVVEAAQCIANAASRLVEAATEVQRELVASGVFCSVNSSKSEDGQWSQGLISAARLVAKSTENLCDVANSAFHGNASEEKLLASTQAISNSTAQLLLACRVKADPNSITQQRLQLAGAAIKKASNTLAEAVQNSGIFKPNNGDLSVHLNKRLVGGMTQELDLMESILQKEKELQKAREALFSLRQQKAAQHKR